MRRPPSSVLVAVAALLTVVAVQVLLASLVASARQPGWGQFVFAAVLAGLLLGGLWAGSRLAWMWGRYLSVLLAVLVAGTALLLVRGPHPLPARFAALLVGGYALPLVIMAAALGRPSALRHFRLYCPSCGAPTRRANDLLFREARCAGCKRVF